MRGIAGRVAAGRLAVEKVGMMHGPEFWIAAVVAAALVGASKGGLPVVGMLGVPVLALTISPVTAAGLLLPVYVLSDMFGLYAYRRAFDRRVLSILIPAATIGVGLGWATASLVSERLVGGLVGLIGAAFAGYILLRPEDRPRPRRAGRLSGTFWGAVCGFTSFVSHAGAPPYQVYVLPLGLEKTVFAGTTTILFAYVNAIKLVPYWALGQLSLDNLKVAAVLTLPAVLAVFAGVWLVRILPPALFFRLVAWALLLVSLKLLWDARPA
jgi:uncharacterized membrane protein YfcA